MAGQPTPRPHACTQCGEAHAKCLGHNRAGKPCGQNPADYQDVCGLHGAKSPQALAKAEQRKNRASAEAAVATYGDPVVGDPFDLIIEEITRTNGHVLWLGQIIAQMEQDELVWGRTGAEETAGSGPMGTTSSSKTVESSAVNIWLDLYKSERAHLVKCCKDAIACGIAERQVRIAEQTGHIIAQVLKATLADPELKLPPAQQAVALRVVSRHLRALPAA